MAYDHVSLRIKRWSIIEGGGNYFGLQFKKVQSIISWIHNIKYVVTQSIMSTEMCGRNNFTQTGKTETQEREIGETTTERQG